MDRSDARKFPKMTSVQCYFCNQFFTNANLQAHITQCGSVLEPCPNKCGVYVPRSNRERHVQECLRSSRKPRPRSSYDGSPPAAFPSGQTSSTTTALESQLLGLKSALLEERQLRQHLQVEVHRLSRLAEKTSAFSQHLASSIDVLKKSQFSDAEARHSAASKIKYDVDDAKLRLRLAEDWRNQTAAGLHGLQSQTADLERSVADHRAILKGHEDRLAELDDVKQLLDAVESTFAEERTLAKAQAMALQEDLDGLKDFHAQENVTVAALWNDHTNDIKLLGERANLADGQLAELSAKLQHVTFDLRGAQQVGLELGDAVRRLDGEVKGVGRAVAQLRTDFAEMERSLAERVLDKTMASSTGGIVWKLADFSAKMKSAKENDTRLHSPIFLTGQNGYKVRLEVYLNGIRKWKGRHIIMSLQVLKSEYDPLLKWPCLIEAKIILRDQSEKQNDISKAINAKRHSGDEENEDPQESSPQYIFIPHSALDRAEYVKNDTAFLQVVVLSDTLKRLETTDM